MTTTPDKFVDATPSETAGDEPTADQSLADAGDSTRAVDAKAAEAPVIMSPDLAARFDPIERQLGEIVRLAEARERTVDRLHEEVQRLRVGELRHAVAPLLRDLLTLHDDLAAAVREHTRNDDELPPGIVDLSVFRDTVGDILYRFGVEPVPIAIGDALSTKEHRVVGTVLTTDLAAERTIAEVVRVGYRDESRIVRFSDVRVFRYTPPDSDPG